MRKVILFMLYFALLFSFAGCSGDGRTEAEDSPRRSHADDEPEFSINKPNFRPESEKQELIDQYGTSFRIRRTFGMQLIRFTFSETTVLREHMDSMKDGTETHDADWDVIDGELVITGEWNETFTLDLENNTATSKTDGEVYNIVKAE